jgi:hypothetical protein
LQAVSKTTKAVAKTAQRVKLVEKPVPCPHCEAPKTIAVHYYPPRGRPLDARGCSKCRAVWKGNVVLARNVAGL